MKNTMNEVNKPFSLDENALRQVIDEAPNGIVIVDSNGTIIYANSQTELMFGYDREELIGNSVDRLVPAELRNAHKDHRADYMTEPSARLMGHMRELHGIRKDGSHFHVEVGLKPIKTDKQIFVIASIVDISKRWEEQKAKAQLAAFVSSASAAIITKDLDGRIQSWNKGAENLLGYSAKEILGKPVEITIPAHKHEEEQSFRQRIREGENIAAFETERIDKAGNLIQVAVSAAPIKDQNDQIIATSTIIWDLTPLKRMEKQLASKLAELERSNEDLQQFAYVCSHDLQEPLRVISNYVQLISKRYEHLLDDKGKQFIHYVVDGAARMQRMVEDLLLYSRAGTEPMRSLIDMKTVLKSVQLNLKLAIEESHAIIEIGDNLPQIYGSELELIQVFQNLIGNAIKFRGEKQPHIRVSHVDDHNTVTVVVEDNGIGFDMKYAQKIFIIFQRLHTRETFPGSGIGLAICKKIVERYHGTLRTESKKSEGTKFFLTFPKTQEVDPLLRVSQDT